MSDELRILILEDVPTDAELMEHALRKAGLAVQAQRVDTREDFERALEAFKPDIVLADYNLPAFTGGEALEIVRRAHPEVPLIIVTGSLGDEAAVELVHQGAKDYVLKSNLAWPGSAMPYGGPSPWKRASVRARLQRRRSNVNGIVLR